MMTTYAFGYYGGKLSHLKRLLPLLPSSGVQTYVEPFGGSAAVMLNRDPAPVEIYNDLDGDIVNFFKVLRDRPDELINHLQLTPYSRAEFVQACERRIDLGEVERARQFFVRISQGRNAVPRTTPGQFSYSISESRLGMSSAVSGYVSLINRLDDVINRLRTVLIECLPAADVIERYDTPDTFFYLDPPYVQDTRNSSACYIHEMTDDDHIALSAVLHQVTARAAISGYSSELYERLYADWYVTRFDTKFLWSSVDNGPGAARQEVLWTNYDPADVHGLDALPLFGGFGR